MSAEDDRETEEPQKAFERLRHVPVGDPGYANAQRLIGHNIFGRAWGRWAEGVVYLENALRAAPNDPKVLEDAGRAMMAVGRLSEARELLERAGTRVADEALRRLDAGG